jgi:hypothetical protein
VTASARQVKEIFITLICFIGFEFGGWESFGIIKLEQKTILYQWREFHARQTFGEHTNIFIRISLFTARTNLS